MSTPAPIDLSLHVISEADPERGIDHLHVARATVEGGAGIFQLRDKDRPPDEMEPLAREATAVCRGGGTACVINDFPEVALRAGAAGTHVGQEDLPLREALGLCLPHGLLVGASATNLAEVLAAEAAGAHYIGLGPIFATPSKADAAPPIGLEGLEAICRRTSVPVVAIGGVNRENAGAVIEHGAAGVAVISAVTHAHDMAEAVRELRHLIALALARRENGDTS